MHPIYTSTLDGYGRANRIPLYIEEVSGDHPQRRYHSHTFSELVLVLYGEAVHLVGAEECAVRRGDLLLLHPGTTHGYDQTLNFGIINLTYDYTRLAMPVLDGYELPLFRNFFPDPGVTFSERQICRPVAHLPEDRVDGFGESIRQLRHELNGSRPGNSFLGMAMFMGIMAQIARAAIIPEAAPSPEKSAASRVSRIGNAIEYLWRHLDEPVNIDAMVQQTTLSRRSFFRIFRKMTGCSPLEYRTRLKLKMAAELLKTTDLSVKEIAIRCNFYDANYLCRLFRQSLGVSPREFRRRR